LVVRIVACPASRLRVHAAKNGQESEDELLAPVEDPHLVEVGKKERRFPTAFHHYF
jgi:hypothetical protein